MTTPILVFVPGILGSELWDGGEKIWPGSLLEAVSGFEPAKFDKLMKPNLEARDIIRAAGGGLIGIYRDWIKAFEAIMRARKGLFRESPPAGSPKTLYPFPYDWRIDLTIIAGRFADFLDRIVVTTQDADLVLVAHSLGGLVARYYLESGTFVSRPAYQKVSLLATLGTPHNGAPVAYAGVAGLHKTNFLSIAQSKTLANDPRYPSLYQTFPSQAHAFIWDANLPNAYRPFEPDDPDLVAKLNLLPASINAWRRFRAGLTGTGPAHTRYFFIVGSRQSTLTRFLWNGTTLQKVELDDAGDGTVPLTGAMVSGVQTELVGKSHVDLIDTKPARQTLARLFGADTLFSIEELASHITLSVRDHVVTTEDDIHLLIEFDPAISTFKGELTWQRAKQPDDGLEPSESDFRDFLGGGSRRIELMGPNITYVNLKASPINIRGIYRPVLTPDGNSAQAVVGPAFAVQQIV